MLQLFGDYAIRLIVIIHSGVLLIGFITAKIGAGLISG